MECGCADRLSRIVDAQRAIAAAGLDLPSVMEVVCERAQELTGADGAAVLLLEDGALVRHAHSGSMAGPPVAGIPLHRGDAVAGELQAFSSGPQVFTAENRSTLELLSSVLVVGPQPRLRGRRAEGVGDDLPEGADRDRPRARSRGPDGRGEPRARADARLHRRRSSPTMRFAEYTHPDDVEREPRAASAS